MTRTAFARAHAYTAAKVGGILDEATRVEGACPHVAQPKPPKWLLGSREDVEKALQAHMDAPAPVKLKDGRVVTRRRRHDHRCLVAGTISHPATMKMARSDPRGSEIIRDWAVDSTRWLQRQYGSRLVGVLLHTDESHPHLHFFIAGDAQRLHPGMRAELENDRRLTDNDERIRRHKAGLKRWLDDYQAQVGDKNHLVRGLGSRPAWRLKDRTLRTKVVELEKRLAQVIDAQMYDEMRAGINEVYDQAEKLPRPVQRF